jgi:glycosyltransferase involved in cell wall biosynthesis
MRFSVVVTALDSLSRDALRRQTYSDFEVRSAGAPLAGEIVAFLGDAIPDPRWLEHLASAFNDATVAAVGGVVFEPDGRRHRHRFAVRDRIGGAPREIEPPLTPFLLAGADPFVVLHESNAAFRREYVTDDSDAVERCRRLIDGGRRVVCLDAAAVYLRQSETVSDSVDEIRPFACDRRLTICFVARKCRPELAQELAAEGHEIRVVVEAEGEPTVRPGMEGVWVHRVPVRLTGGWDCPDLRPASRDALGWAAAAHAEVRAIAAVRPVDLVVAPVGAVEGLFCLLDAALKTVLTLGTTLRATADEDPVRQVDPAFPHLVELERFALNHASHLIASNRAALARVPRDYGFRVAGVVIPPGLSQPVDSQGSPGSTVRVLALARPGRAGGADLFLAAAAELGPEFPETEFVIAGGASEIVGADIACVPARHEANESWVVRAMAHGKPVVAVSVGGLKEIVVDGATGHLTYPGSARSLAASLRPLLASGALRERYGAAGRRRYEENFRSESVVREAVREFTAVAESFAA